MPDLSFAVERVSPVAHAAAPMLTFHVRIVNAGIERINAIVLDSRIQVEAPRRPPSAQVNDRLEELFGEPSHWADSVQTMPWARATAVVAPFAGSTRCDIDVPCSFDFNVAATKYFYGLNASSVPLRIDFTGTIFSDGKVIQIARGKQARFSMPACAWTDLMDAYYPQSVWLRLPRDVFHRMNQYKIDHKIPTWEDVLERLLPAGQEAVH